MRCGKEERVFKRYLNVDVLVVERSNIERGIQVVGTVKARALILKL